MLLLRWLSDDGREIAFQYLCMGDDTQRIPVPVAGDSPEYRAQLRQLQHDREQLRAAGAAVVLAGTMRDDPVS